MTESVENLILEHLRHMRAAIDRIEIRLAAGAPEEKARKAAEALTVHENRFSKIEADLLVLKWMVGFVLALLAAIAMKLFLH